MNTLAQDLRYALRALGRSPGFAAVAVATLALGIGANTAIFSVVHAVLLRPLPYPEAHRLVVVTERRLRLGEQSVSWMNFLDWRAGSRALAAQAAYGTDGVAFAGTGEPSVLRSGEVTAPFFSILGVQPALGRAFTEADDRPGAAPVALLSAALWRSRFGSDPSVVGRAIRLDGVPHVVVGVLPESFRFFPQPVDLYRPLGRHGAEPGWLERGNHQGLRVLARLAPGSTLPAARAELDTIMARLETQYPRTNSGQRTMVVPLFESGVAESRTTLWTLFAAVAFVLLLACANVAHLLLARATARQRELAIRAAIGASRARVVRQLLTESVLLALLGGGLGLLLAVWATPPLLAAAPEDIPRLAEAGVDGTVLLFSFAASVATGILFGLAPALAAFRTDPQSALKDGIFGATASARGRRQRAALFVAEVALAFLVVVASGLLLRSLARVRAVDPGFSSDGVLAMNVSRPAAETEADSQVFFTGALARLRALPGVRSASAVLCPPLMGPCWGSVYMVSDRPAPPQADLPSATINVADPDFFRTLSIPLMAGRLFGPQDTADSPPVIVVNETLAKLWWPRGDAVGKRIKRGFPQDEGAPFREIVGIVADVRQEGLDLPPRPELYMPFAQQPNQSMTIVLAASNDPMSLAKPAAAAVHAIDPDQPVSRVEPLERYFGESLARRHFTTLLLALFGALALTLAAVGITGVVACGVGERRREIGIRTALGAKPSDVLRLVIDHALRLAAAGIVLGGAAALGLTRFVSSLLYGVKPFDPLTFGGVAALLTVVVLAACAWPARRALRVSPTTALRAE